MAASLWFQNVWKNQVPSEVLQPYMIYLDERIEPSKEKARGAYGAVFEVKYNGAVCVGKRILDILVGLGGHQLVDEDQYMPLLEKFRQECDLMSKMRHPNVVQFLGIYQPSPDPRDLTLVMEKLHIDLGRLIGKQRNIPLSIKLSILRDVSSGLLHIHSHGVIHRDLNAGNILLTEQLCAKVADFGMSRVLPQNISNSPIRGSMTIMPGAADYMPPEAVEGEYDQKLDTFSFGHVALYLINEEYPQPVHMNWKRVGEIKDGIEMERRRTWLKKMGQQHCLYYLIIACLQDEPEERATMLALNTNLNELCAAYPYKLEDVMKISCPEIVNTDLSDQLKEYQTAVKEFVQKLPGIDLKVISERDRRKENEEVDQMKAELTTLTNAKEEMENQMTAITTEKEEAEVRLAAVTNEKEELQSQVAELLQAQMELKNEHDRELQEVRDSMSVQIVHMEQENVQLCQMNDENMAKVHQHEETIERLHEDIENLRNTERSLEQLNLTVRNLESRNSALESRYIQLEHQNLQMVEDRKNLKERLQAIEKLYQKTLQEKMELEKDLQYNANHQLLSYHFLDTKPETSDREHVELTTRDITALKTISERIQSNSTVVINEDKTLPLTLDISDDHKLLRSDLTSEIPGMVKEPNTLNPEERREDPLLPSNTRYTTIPAPAKPNPPPRGYNPQKVGINLLPVAIETEDDEQPLTSLGAKLLKRRQKIESAQEHPSPHIFSTENVSQRTPPPTSQTTDDITKQDGAKMNLEIRQLVMGISDDHDNVLNEIPGMAKKSNTLNLEERKEEPLLPSTTRYTPIPAPATRYTPIPAPAKPTPPPRGYNPQKVGINLLPVAIETEDDEQPLTSLGAKLLKRRQKIESAQEHPTPDIFSTENASQRTPRPASQTTDDIIKQDGAKMNQQRKWSTLGRPQPVAKNPNLGQKDDNLQAILERQRKLSEN